MINPEKDTKKKPWPKNAPWPEPTDFSFDYDEDYIPSALDEETEDLIEIKDYYDSLVEEGRLNDDYSLCEEYDENEEEEDDEFYPEKGEEYWSENRFQIEWWRDELSDRLNLLQIGFMREGQNPVVALRSVFSYEFINENLLRQAFTRRSFQIEYGLPGCSEELEFLGDTILSAVVTKEIFRQFSKNDTNRYEAPFDSKYNEGELTKIREQFISKEALASRARELGIGRFILYGAGEKETDSILSDTMEALIGAVTIDSDWDEDAIEYFVDELVSIQLDSSDSYLKKSYYDILNSWHQKHFGFIPSYKVYEEKNKAGYYECYLEYRIPENDKEILLKQYANGVGDTRSRARDDAARKAYYFIAENGLLKNLNQAGIYPDLDNSINQLQELYQKKYIDSLPVYEYEHSDFNDRWHVYCRVESFCGWGKAKAKVKAKKLASFMVLIRMMESAGINNDEWEKILWDDMEL